MPLLTNFASGPDGPSSLRSDVFAAVARQALVCIPLRSYVASSIFSVSRQTSFASTEPLVRPVHIRRLRPGEEAALRQVFYSSVHGLASGHYTEDQLRSWASASYDADAWTARIRRMDPFVAERQGAIVAYADLQRDGHIDHFYVAAGAAGRGVGTALMRKIEVEARSRGLDTLYANVSINAQPFFERFGFVRTYEQEVEREGLVLRNARMVKRLVATQISD